MKKNITSGITICLFLSLVACSNAEQETKTETTTADTTASAAAAAATQPAALSGKILETMNSGGYTYLQIDTGTSQPWIALPQSNVKVGDDVSCLPGMTMNNFESKTLNRTFASLVFSPGIVGNAGDPHGGMMGAMGNQGASGDDSFASAVQAEGGSPAMQPTAGGSGGSKGAAVPFSEINVEKATGENGYSVQEIFATTKELDGKTVRIQGKVVKYSPMIMGRNWIHLQDGTGSPADNTHDLVVTTSEEIQKDTVITIEGVVAYQKDFGAGYKYVAIVEDAKTVK